MQETSGNLHFFHFRERMQPKSLMKTEHKVDQQNHKWNKTHHFEAMRNQSTTNTSIIFIA